MAPRFDAYLAAVVEHISAARVQFFVEAVLDETGWGDEGACDPAGEQGLG